MIHSFTQRLYQTFFHPLFLLLVAPMAYLLPGTFYACYFVELHFPHLLFLYLFVLVNEFLEKLFKKNYRQHTKIPMSPFVVFNFVSGLLILYFVFYLHVLAALLLLCYSIVMQTKIYLYRFHLSTLPSFLTAFFKGGVLLYLSFYIQLNFIPGNLFYWSIPIIFVSAVSELGTHCISKRLTAHLQKTEDNGKNDDSNTYSLFLLYAVALLGLYVVSLVFWWGTFQHLIWLSLLSLPLARQLLQHVRSTHVSTHWKIHEKQLTWFLTVHTLIFTCLILFHFHF